MMNGQLTDANVCIFTATRDRPVELKRTLQGIIQDLETSEQSISLRSVVIDDSNREENIRENIQTVHSLSIDFPQGCFYFGREELREYEQTIPGNFLRIFHEAIKPLGADFYDSVGPRNLGLLLTYSSDFTFIVDDDVVIFHLQLGNKNSVIATMLDALKKNEGHIVGAKWIGIPDQSTLEHLDDQAYSQITPGVGLPPSYDEPFREQITPRTIGWRRQFPSYVTCGGGMAFRSELNSVPFAKIFNDDWHWLSYHVSNGAKVKTLDNVTFLNRPPGWRVPTPETLVREMLGEIVFEAMHQYSEAGKQNAWEATGEVDWHRVRDQYGNFLKSVREDVYRLASERAVPIDQSPFRDYGRVVNYLNDTIDKLERTSPKTFNRIVDMYISAIGRWSELVSELKARESSWLNTR